MEDLAKIDSIIFDMDGTLWDGVEAYAQGFNDFFRANNIDRVLTKNDLYGYMGLEEDQYLEVTMPEFPYSERKEKYKHIIDFQYKRIQSEGGVLYDGVKEGLAKLAEKYMLFIVSNCPEFTIKYFMEWAGIEEFITDTLSHGMNYKSKHENIKLLIEKHALQSPVYVGDADSDRQQCDLAEIPFIFVKYGFGKATSYALCFDSFEQLIEDFV
jgi:phosphoglycolate phosphatase